MLTKEEVQHLAILSRLRLNENEIDTFVTQLSSVLDFVQKIQSIDTTTVTELAHTSGLKTVMREDVAVPWDAPGALVEAAQQQNGDYVETPAIF